ncbi:MAG: protein-disulfide isomerase [Patiriisocius sp.]|jgi:protein-disulfide isomerase
MDPEVTTDAVQEQTPVPQQSNPFIIPGAIVIGFAFIAAAIFFSGAAAPKTAPVANQPYGDEQEEVATESIRPIDENDHILGNPNAPIVIVEYSDFDCPFCKNFHETMNSILADYGSTGQVAWVYRQFPIEQLHPNAPQIALASECVANLGGNESFWKFADLIFGERGTNEPTNMTQIGSYAAQSGVNQTAFESCLASGELQSLVEEDLQDGVAAGIQGTPHSIVLVGGQQGVISGAQPYEAVKQIVETLLSQIEAAGETQ